MDKFANSPFAHFHTRVPAVEIVRSHEDHSRQAREGYRVNYFGVAIPDSVIPGSILAHVPPLEVDPLPNNWHADTAEFAAALRAVDLAQASFTMVELGCGWGCWMNITGLCAKRKGLGVKLIGVEGDRHHLNLAQAALAANGLAPSEYTLVHGIAHASTGTAAFPQQQPGEDHWGLEPVFSTEEQKYRAALKTGKYAELPMIGFRELTADVARVDLLHVDIQGGERLLVESCIDIFSEKVGFIVIGTHSREIEGALFETFLKAGWLLEIERPAILALNDTGPVVTVDGVQGWRNPKLTHIGGRAESLGKAAQARVGALLTSTTWRDTAPLRKLKQLFKR